MVKIEVIQESELILSEMLSISTDVVTTLCDPKLGAIESETFDVLPMITVRHCKTGYGYSVTCRLVYKYIGSELVDREFRTIGLKAHREAMHGFLNTLVKVVTLLLSDYGAARGTPSITVTDYYVKAIINIAKLQRCRIGDVETELLISPDGVFYGVRYGLNVDGVDEQVITFLPEYRGLLTIDLAEQKYLTSDTFTETIIY